MAYTLTQEVIDSVTDQELARGTDRLLPKPEDIPDEFYGSFKGYGVGNVYFRMAEALYIGDPVPKAEVDFNPGFVAGPGFRKCITAHIRSFEPEHQHKIAGIAYMLSIIVTVKE